MKRALIVLAGMAVVVLSGCSVGESVRAFSSYAAPAEAESLMAPPDFRASDLTLRHQAIKFEETKAGGKFAHLLTGPVGREYADFKLHENNAAGAINAQYELHSGYIFLMHPVQWTLGRTTRVTGGVDAFTRKPLCTTDHKVAMVYYRSPKDNIDRIYVLNTNCNVCNKPSITFKYDQDTKTVELGEYVEVKNNKLTKSSIAGSIPALLFLYQVKQQAKAMDLEWQDPLDVDLSTGDETW